MFSDSTYDDLISTMYEAALDPERWRTVVDIITNGFGAIGSSIYTPFAVKFGEEPVWSTDADPEYIAAYASKYAHQDKVAELLWQRVPTPSLIYCWRDLANRAEIESWDAYQDLLRPRGVRETVGLLVSAEDHRATQLNIYCAKTDATYIAAVKEVYRRIESHFSRALKIHWHLSASRRNAGVATVTLNMFRTGVAWLSDQGEILYMNPEAERLVALRDGLGITNGRFSFNYPGTNGSLLRAIEMALGNLSSAFPIERRVQSEPFRMSIMPLPLQATALRIPHAAAIAFLTETSEPTEGSVDLARKLYRLTPAEQKIVAALVVGEDARLISNRYGASIETVRTQIKSSMAKCGVTRQADLIRLITSLPQLTA